MQRHSDQRQYRPDSLDWLSEELREEVRFSDDADLKADIYDWLQAVTELPSGDVLDVVDQHLTKARHIEGETEGLGEYPMRRLDGDGTENFPDSCSGCPHYGTRCPVFVDPVERSQREQLQDKFADASTSAKRRAYRQYAEDVGCHQITGALKDHVEQFTDLQQRGIDLYRRADSTVGFTDEAEEAARLEAEATQGGR